jgi:hypothetical protein
MKNPDLAGPGNAFDSRRISGSLFVALLEGLDGVAHLLAGTLDFLEALADTGAGCGVAFFGELDHVFFDDGDQLLDFFVLFHGSKCLGFDDGKEFEVEG